MKKRVSESSRSRAEQRLSGKPHAATPEAVVLSIVMQAAFLPAARLWSNGGEAPRSSRRAASEAQVRDTPTVKSEMIVGLVVRGRRARAAMRAQMV